MLSISAGNFRGFWNCPRRCDHELFTSATCSSKAFLNKRISEALAGFFCLSAASLQIPEGEVSQREEEGQQWGEFSAQNWPISTHEWD